MEKSRVSCLVVLFVLGSATAQQPAQQRKIRPVPNTFAGVVQYAGKPIIGAAVRVVWLKHPELPRSLQRALGPGVSRSLRAKSKAKGQFRIGLPHRGPFAVCVEHEGKRSPIRYPVFAGDFVTLRLQKTHFITGRVVDAAGDPVADARVGKVRPASWASEIRVVQFPVEPEVVRTDAAGRFRLPVWPPGALPTMEPRGLAAWKGSVASIGAFYFNTGQVADQVELRLTRSTAGVAMRGDKPIAGADVFDPFCTGATAKTDESGRYVLENTPASVVSVRGKDVWYVRSTNGMTASHPPQPIHLKLQHSSANLVGRRVLFAAPVGQRGHIPFVTKVGAAGVVEARGAGIGVPLSGFVEFEGRFVPFLNRVPAKCDLGTISIAPERTLAGRIRDANGRPVTHVDVLLQPLLTDEEYARLGDKQRPNQNLLSLVTHTDRAGRYRFDAVWPGPLLVCVMGGSCGVQVFRIPGDHAGARDLRMSEGRIVTGVVTLPNGKPAAHSIVQYIARFDGDVPRFSKRYGMCYLYLTTDANGRFRVDGLSAHTSYTCYALHAHDGVGYRALKTSSATGHGIHKISLDLKVHAARNN